MASSWKISYFISVNVYFISCNCHAPGLFLLCFCYMCILWPSSSLVWLLILIPGVSPFVPCYPVFKTPVCSVCHCWVSIVLYVCLPCPQCGLPCVVDYNKDCFCYSTSPAITSSSVRDSKEDVFMALVKNNNPPC